MRLFCTLILFFFSKILLAQSTDTIHGIKNFSLDMFGNCYAIRENEILKIDENGKIVSTFSKNDIGEPVSVDASNPLRVLVFYKDFAVIRILDNQMSEQSSVDLRQSGFGNVTLAWASNDEGIWVFDQSNANLVKLDTRLKNNQTAMDLRQLLEKEINPTEVESTKNWMLLRDGKNLFVFDQFGTYTKTMTTPCDPVLLQLEENMLYTACENFAEVTDLKIFNSTKKIDLPLPSNTVKSRFFKQNKYFLSGNLLVIRRGEK